VHQALGRRRREDSPDRAAPGRSDHQQAGVLGLGGLMERAAALVLCTRRTSIARPSGLRVITVARLGFASYGETEARTAERGGRGFEDVEGEHRVRAEHAANDAAAALGDDVTVEVDAFLEDPADALIRVSQNLDLLVCGSRGYGPVRTVLLGGVSRRVTASAHCPVIVLPCGVKSPLEDLMSETPGATGR
jgi:nucleotide-binding universal stress UspA family protein